MRRRYLAGIIFLLLGLVALIYFIPFDRSIFAKGEIRAAIDIGSGSTNLKIAKVDPQTNKITFIYLEKSIPVPYQKHLENSVDQTFDPEVMNQGIKALNKLKGIAENYQVKKIVAVATAAFRQAKNSEQFVQEIGQKTGIQVRIINQDEEGIMAFRGALAVTSFEPNQVVTWDIGGGSMQLTTLTPEGTYFVDKGKTASIPYKNGIIQDIQHRDLKATHTPNPMTKEEMEQAISYAENLAQETNPFIQNKIKEPTTQVLAVGSLFNFGIRPLVNHSTVQRTALEKSILPLANKTDAQLPGGPLAEVAISNPLLVLGYMQGLHIEKLDIISVNNADGALTYPPYWSNN